MPTVIPPGTASVTPPDAGRTGGPLTRGGRRRRRWALWVPGLLLAALLVVFGLGEWAGWPFLREPLANLLSSRLDRRVTFGEGAGAFRLRLLGGLQLRAAQFQIAAPAWSQTPHLLQGQDVDLRLRYSDLWRAWHPSGVQPLRVEGLAAAHIDVQAERLADGRVSWQFGPPAAAASAPPVPQFGALRLAAGTLRFSDLAHGTDIQAIASLSEGTESQAAPGDAAGLKLDATGRYQHLPLKLTLRSAGALPWVADSESGTPVAVTVQATVGRATLAFDGSAADALHLGNLKGHFRLQGPSLAAAGDPLHVTLPTTAAFHAEGEITHRDRTWLAQVAAMTVGSSRLHGTFAYQQGPGVPKLTGQLSGARLMLVDLGPTVGTTAVTTSAATSAATSATTSASAAAAAPPKIPAAAPRAPGKVLPTRPFDLAALRAMDADVRVDIAEADLNTALLEPLRPLRAHLVLAGGVLDLSELDARTAQGSLRGSLRLDGRGDIALWNVDLRWSGVQLERWLHLERTAGATPWVSGRLNGNAVLQGRGRSTAEILASLQGHSRTELQGGRVSHLAVEAAGLDIAGALGVLIKGDDALPVHCAVADLEAKDGVFRPRTMVLDTSNSVIWVDGTLSLASENMDLRLVVVPRDFSPLALRTPLRLSGTFAAPALSLDRKPLAGKVGLALLLALINPLAAIVPLIDPGDAAAATRDAAGCQGLVQRSARPAKADIQQAAPPRGR